MPENAGNIPSDPCDMTPVHAVKERILSPVARRALAEAEERRLAQTQREAELATQDEVNGRGGKDPVRYNDWEIKGIASDF